MIKRFIFLITIGSMLAVAPLKAQEFAPVGTAVSQFLEVKMGARAVAMGEAYTVLSDNAGAAFWNPANLVDIPRRNFFLTYTDWPADISFGAFSIASNFGTYGTLSLSGIFLSTEDMEVTTPEMPEGTGETFGISNYAMGISYSRFFTDRLSFGMTGKLVHEGYMEYEYTSWALDLGTIYRTGFRNMKIGMSILHFGPEVHFSGSFLDYSDPKSISVDEEKEFESYSLPVNFRVGFCIDVWQQNNHKIITAADMVHPNNNLEQYNWGLEYGFNDLIFLRGGYRFNVDEGGFSIGTGARFNWFGSNDATIDYAFSERGVIANIHRLEVGISF